MRLLDQKTVNELAAQIAQLAELLAKAKKAFASTAK